MKRFFRDKQLAVITGVYWFLLVYIIAALVWWFISLETQNNQMYVFKSRQLKEDEPAYFQKETSLQDERDRRHAQYIGEGITFLLLILVGAVFVYRATRRQLLLSRQQQNFMMAVTHELKTPIAITRLNLETLQKRKLDAAQQQQLIAVSLQEANRLNTLTNNILVASQLESGNYRLNKQELDFSALTREIVNDFRQRFPDKKLEASIPDAVYINGETLLLQLLVNNLLDNAMKYAPKTSVIRLALADTNGRVKLSVADEGPGIPDEEKKKVFRKFYRIGVEATRTAKGTGLGLYLCKKIVHDHNGSIRITNNQPAGSIFTVTLQSFEP